MKKLSLIILVMTLMRSFALTDVLFQETFPNESGQNQALSVIEWKANVTAMAKDRSASANWRNNPIVSGHKFLFFKAEGATIGQPWLAWTDKADVFDVGCIGNVTYISAKFNNDVSAEEVKIALKVNENWYVSQQGLRGTGRILENLEIQSASWNSLTFVPGVSLIEGTPSALPSSGKVQAIGVFQASATSDRIRISDLIVAAGSKPKSENLAVQIPVRADNEGGGVDPDAGGGASGRMAFDAAPMIIENPAATEGYAARNRSAQGVPSLAVAPGGRMWAAWYAGTTPNTIIERCDNAYVVVATSGDGGNTWKEVLAIDPDGPGPVKAYDPLPWVDPDGKLWIIWHHTMPPRAFAMIADDADADNPAWSEPRLITRGIMMNKPAILSTGEWMFPVAERITGQISHMRAMIVENGGDSFHDRGYAAMDYEGNQPIEPMIVEKSDGSLWMLVRTVYGIHESFSSDRGKTWSPLEPSPIKHTTSRFFITRLTSGSLLLVKHGQIDERTEGPTQRRELMAFLSDDDGVTWSDGLMLDERAPVSYPDGQQTEDGRIHIIWDHSRSRKHDILMASFTEDDIRSNADIEAKVISRGAFD
jgi:hypothetical protein